MSNLLLHNTLTGKKEAFVPIRTGHVGLYVCGITPYDESHLGHARCYVVFDVLKRVLLHLNFKVKHIQNFTDVDDKIIDRARELNQDAVKFPEPYIESYKSYMKQLNVMPPDAYPRVTEKMPQIVELVERLIKSGKAYELDGDVYYSVRKFSGYGKLSKRKIDELESGARVDVDTRKKDPLDFALWKKAKEGEPSWPSPWGAGRPGWHIECSAMSMEALGDTFDIHGGGQDLIFPHHENEIAQSEGVTQKPFARYWVHNGFVTINKEKMSKSLGNFFTIKDILAKFDPMVVRYFLISQHYKSPLNFSDQDLEATKKVWVDRICGAHAIVVKGETESKLQPVHKPAIDTDLNKFSEKFVTALLDDMNTPVALASLNDYCSHVFALEKTVGLSADDWAKIKKPLDEMLSLLGLKIPEIVWSDDVKALVQERESARQSKNWARSDELRDKLKSLGVLVEDAATGPRLKKI